MTSTSFENLDPETRQEILSLMKTSRDWTYIKSRLSEQGRQGLAHAYKKTALEKKAAESLAVIQMLNEHLISFVTLKGITFWIHNKEREMGDVDILVDPDHILKVAGILKEKLGYAYDPTDFLRYRTQKGHHLSLTHATLIPVELHYYPFDCFYDRSFNFLSHTTTIQIHDVTVPVLTPELRLLSVFLHSFYNHGFLENYDKVLKDISIITAQESIDWDVFMNLIRTLDCNEIVYRGLGLLAHLYGEKVPIPSHIDKYLTSHNKPLRLYLTRSFKPLLFLNNQKYLRERVITNPAADTLWRMRNSLKFTFGWNKRFFRLVWIYLWVFIFRGPDIWAALTRKNP